MNIVIVGQGAMGLLWYHHIQQLIESSSNYSDTQLHLLASKKSDLNKPSLQKNRYIFIDHNNQEHHGKVNIAHTEQVQAADIIILCLKSFKIAAVLKEISDKLKNNVNIILAHNGMGTLDELSPHILNKKDVNKKNIYALLTTHGCLRTEHLAITHTGVGTTDIGLLSGVADLKTPSFYQLLNTALPPVKFHKEIKHKQWLKLAINCVINPLTAIHNIKNGQVTNDEFQSLVITLLKEITNVASAEKINLDLSELIKTVNKVARATANNSSSMRCDILANRQSEIDYINGYIHRLGIKHDIATPENTKMWQAVTFLTK